MRVLSPRNALLVAVLWTVGVAALLILRVPAPVERLAGGLADLLALDKVVHALLFFGVTRSWLVAAQPVRAGATLAIAVGVIAYGGALELLQETVPDRGGEWLDFVADGAGALTASFCRAGLSPLPVDSSGSGG